MDKIISDLKYFKEHINNSKKVGGTKGAKKSVNTSAVSRKGKDSNIESGDNTTAPSQQASRPRTSRGNRPSSKVGKRGEGSGGNSAMGFHSNMPNHHLFYNNVGDTSKLHNKSANEAIDSPRSKVTLSRQAKGRISPSTFLKNHHRQPSAATKQINHKRNPSLEAEKMALINKNRPQSANLKKKHGKSAERLKKKAIARQRIQDIQDSSFKNNSKLVNYSKDGPISKSMIDNNILTDGNSFDHEEILRYKLMKKNLGIAKNGEVKLQMSGQNKAIITKKGVSKFVMYKRPEQPTNNPISYEQFNYSDHNFKYNNVSMDRSMFRKNTYQIDKKKQAKLVTTQSKKSKHKRSATPSLTAPQQIMAQGLNPNAYKIKKSYF